MPPIPSIVGQNQGNLIIVQSTTGTGPLPSPYHWQPGGGSATLPDGTVLCSPPSGAPGQAAPSWITISGGALLINPPSFNSTNFLGFLFWASLSANGVTNYTRFFLSYGVSYAATPGQYLESGTGTHALGFLTNDVVFGAIAGQAFSFPVYVSLGATSNDKPSWLTLTPNSNATIYTASGIAPPAAGTYGFNLHGQNSNGSLKDDTRLYILVSPPSAPVVNATTGTARKGLALTYQIAATNSPTSYDADNLPAGLAIDQGTGQITGTPTASGTFSVALSATNAGGTGSGTWTLTVTLPPAPVMNNADATGTAGVTFTYQIAATNSPTGYAADGLPGGLSVNAATGAIAGTPTVAGDSNVTLSATNGGGTSTQSVVFTVQPAATPTGGTGGSTPTAPTTSPFALIQIDLPSGSVTAQAGALSVNHGDAIIFQVQFGPVEFVGTVSNLAFTVKEKSELTQYLSLVTGSGASSADGLNFLFPAVAISGAALDTSLTLLDFLAPLALVTYSLQFTYLWNGRSRSSDILDLVVKRDLSFSSATGATSTGTVPPATGPQAPVNPIFVADTDAIRALDSAALAIGTYRGAQKPAGGLGFWRLRAGSDDDDGYGILRGHDFDANSNTRVWELAL